MKRVFSAHNCAAHHCAAHHCAALLCALFLLPALAAVFGGTLPASAKAKFDMEIPYGHATIDGTVGEDEYGSTYVMDRKSATAWVGQVGTSKVTWHLCWDEEGLYYAGTINDRTPTWRDGSSHWVGIDCLELAVNPGEMLSGETVEGIFFSFGATADGEVVAYRHNYLDGIVSDRITGKSSGHTDGSSSYTIEVFIPWSLIQMNTDCTIGGKTDQHINTTSFEPKAGAVLGLLPCAIDASATETANSGILAAYKFNGTDFMVSDFVHATLLAAPGTETDPDTAPETEPVTETAAVSDPDPETTTAPATQPAPEVTSEASDSETTPVASSGCQSAAVLALPALFILPALLRKKKR